MSKKSPKPEHSLMLVCFFLLSQLYISSLAFADSSNTANGLDSLDQEIYEIIPSNVFRYTELIIEEINILKSVLTMDVEAYEPDYSAGKSPIHVYSKGLEVLEKVARTQKKLGITPIIKVGEIPIKTINPADVFKLSKIILGELRNIKQHLFLNEKSKNIALVTGKVPSDVYHNFWKASYILDLLSKQPITPNDVHRNVLYITDEIQLIGAKLKIPLSHQKPAIKLKKTPKNITQQALLTLHKIANLQKQLDMKMGFIPEISLARIRPSDVYDLSNIILAELVRIKVRLNIQSPRGQRKLSKEKTSRNVFSQMLLINNNLSSIVSMNAVF
jgi:hypothetical protein